LVPIDMTMSVKGTGWRHLYIFASGQAPLSLPQTGRAFVDRIPSGPPSDPGGCASLGIGKPRTPAPSPGLLARHGVTSGLVVPGFEIPDRDAVAPVLPRGRRYDLRHLVAINRRGV
jgi:hypothetical protein